LGWPINSLLYGENSYGENSQIRAISSTGESLINRGDSCDEAEKFPSFSSRLVKEKLTKTPPPTPV
jgi:hypothetical protein